MKTGLEVFDFKEEEELAEHASAKFLEKIKNPSLHNSVSLSREFVECVSQESDVLSQKLNGLASMDVDGTESDHNCDADDTNTPMETKEEDFVSHDGTSSSESDPQLGSRIHQQESHSVIPNDESRNLLSMIPNDESRNLLTEEEARESCFAEPWSEKRVVNYDPSYSPSSSVPDDERSDDDDECMNEDPPSSPAPNIAEENAVFGNITSNHHFSNNTGMDGVVDVAVDYVLYRDIYFTGCLVTFSCSGIKISGSSELGDEGTFSLQKGIDDVIRIEHHLDRMGTVNVKLCFLSKEAEQADSSGVEELEFAAVGPNWPEILEDILSMNVKYFSLLSVMSDINVSTDGGAEFLQQRPYFPKFNESFEDVIYPKGDSDAVSISKRDVDLLQPETFINDTIIDFYIKYLKNQIPPEEKCRFHFFNSFFFRKLADMDKDPNSALDGRAAFLRVQKWTRKVDIFGKDYIFIPVNFNLHWSLLVICHPGEAANFKDGDADKSLKVPCILHMDSIRGTHAGLRSLVQSYLWEEWKSRQKEVSEEVSSKFLNMRFVSLELPQQENSFDCGLFLLHYLELFLVDAPVNFSPFRINDFSKFLNVDWFPPAEASLKRTLIERLIYELLENCYRDVTSGARSDERQSNMLENNENEKEVGIEFLQERCSTAYGSHGSLSTSEAGQGIEITLLASSSMRNTQCVNNDQGLVFREFLNSGVAAGSLLAQCAPFDQSSSFYRLNCPVSQMEDDVEAGEQFGYYPSGEAVFQQFNGLTTPTGSIPYSFRGFRDDNTWNPGISAQEDDTRSSAGTSTYDSDDSDVGIIENFPMAKITRLETTNREQSPSMGNRDPVTAVSASATCGMPETCVGEVTEDPDKMQGNDNKNSNLASGLENPIPSMQKTAIMEQNGIHCHIEEAEGNNLLAIDNQLKSNVASDEVQTLNDDDANTGADYNGLQTIEENLNTDEVQTLNDDDANSGADCNDLQTIEENLNTDGGNDARKADENVNTDVAGGDVQTTDEKNLTSNVTGHDFESIDDVATVVSGDVQATDDKVESTITSNDNTAKNYCGDSEQTGDDEIMTNISANEFQTVDDGITKIFNGNNEERNADHTTRDLDENQASKRRKLTPSVEGELGPMGSLLNDLDLSNDIHL